MKVLKYSGIAVFGLLFVAIAYAPSIAGNNVTTYTTLSIICLSLSALIISAVAYRGYVQLSERWQQRLLLGAIGVLAIVQVYVAVSFVDYGRADSFFVRNQAISLAQGSHVWSSYFQVYSNNVSVVSFEATLIKSLHLLGFHSPWIAINLLQFAWIDTGLWAGLHLLQAWQHGQARILLVLGWLVAVPVYAYALFVYSDPLVMPVPLLVAWLWVSAQQAATRWQRSRRLWLLALLLAFAVAIKANTVVYLIALVLMALIQVMKKQLHWRPFIGLMVKLTVALLVMVGLGRTAGQAYGYHKQANQALPATSWVAMALNPQTTGAYNYPDAHTQMLLPTHQAKVRSEQRLIAHRLQRLGLTGLARHTLLKAGVFLTSGTFDALKLSSQWQRQPAWYASHAQVINDVVKMMSQVFYATAMLGCMALWRQHRSLMGNTFLTLAALGLAAFHIVFWEVEARYALPLLPLFMLWGATGVTHVAEHVTGRVRRRLLVLVAVGVLVLTNLSGRSSVVRANTENNQSVVAEQGNGRYFNNEFLHLTRGQQLVSRIVVGTKNSSLTLKSRRHSQSRAKIELLMNGKVIKRVVRSGQRALQLNYPTQQAGTLTVRMTSIGPHSFAVGDVSSSYPVARYHLAGHAHEYLRYYVRANKV